MHDCEGMQLVGVVHGSDDTGLDGDCRIVNRVQVGDRTSAIGGTQRAAVVLRPVG